MHNKKLPLLLMFSMALIAESQEKNNLFDCFTFNIGEHEIKIDDNEYLKSINEQVQKEEEKNKLNKQLNQTDIPAWLIQSSLKHMPYLLRGIFNYLKLHTRVNTVPSYHRFILVGEPGTGKTTLAQSIAHALGYEIVFIHASTLFGKYRNHTAVNLREIFDGIKRESSNIVIIIDELHKLFENYEHEQTDDAASATAFWNQLDELEKSNHNIVVIGTANSVDKLPPEIKSRFHGKMIEISQPSAKQRREALHEILMNDASIRISDSLDVSFWDYLNKRLNHFSLRDVQLLIDTAKMFKYAEMNEVKEDILILEKRHFQQALDKLVLESKEKWYKKIKSYWNNLSSGTHTVAEIGFIITMLVGAGAGGKAYAPALLMKAQNGIDVLKKKVIMRNSVG